MKICSLYYVFMFIRKSDESDDDLWYHRTTLNKEYNLLSSPGSGRLIILKKSEHFKHLVLLQTKEF